MSGHPHHERAIATLVEIVAARGSLGLVIVGSVARGTARADSDVDAYEIVSDDAFSEAVRSGTVAWFDGSFCDWPHGYVDVKLASMAYLQRAAAHGDDPIRASFVGARVVLDRNGGLASLVGDVANPARAHFDQLIDSFSAALELHGFYFLPGALDRGDRLHAVSSTVHAGFAAARVVLAVDGILFRGAKYLSSQLEDAPACPSGLPDLLARAVREPSVPLMSQIRSALDPWLGVRHDATDAVLGRFILDNEMSWYTGVPPAEYR